MKRKMNLTAQDKKKNNSVFSILFIYSVVMFRTGPSILSERQGRETSTESHWLEGRLPSPSV